MESRESRKEAIRKFKEHKAPQGAFAIRCAASGRVWVGSSNNLDAIRNRTWFTLRHGSHPESSLQSEWNRHGEQSFAYEVLEQLDDDAHALEIADLLSAAKAAWIERLGAAPIR
jgi:hypothetical protein